MAERFPRREIARKEEYALFQTFQVEALVQLLMDKGLISDQEFYLKLLDVQSEYELERTMLTEM